MNFEVIPAGEHFPNELNVIVEMAAHADPVKYQVAPAYGVLCVERFMLTSMRYPCNYGRIPRTLGKNGLPLDAIVMTPFAIMPGALVQCRPVGLLKLTGEAGPDNKVLVVPLDAICPMTAHYRTIEDVPDYLLQELRHFFVNYKVLEHGKWSRFEGWGTREEALVELEDCLDARGAATVPVTP